jgi:hypothetical protein
MSTNKPIIGSVVLEIALDIWGNCLKTWNFFSVAVLPIRQKNILKNKEKQTQKTNKLKKFDLA